MAGEGPSWHVSWLVAMELIGARGQRSRAPQNTWKHRRGGRERDNKLTSAKKGGGDGSVRQVEHGGSWCFGGGSPNALSVSRSVGESEM